MPSRTETTGLGFDGTRCPLTLKCYDPGMHPSPSDFPFDPLVEILRQQFQLDRHFHLRPLAPWGQLQCLRHLSDRLGLMRQHFPLDQ